MVQCFGRAFHYKDGVAAFFPSAGVASPLIDQYRHEAKFIWARHVLTDLGRTEEGCVAQRKVLAFLCSLRNVPDPKVPDRDDALAALRVLKELAPDLDLVAREVAQKGDDHRRVAEERARQVSDRAARLEGLKTTFTEALISPDRQRAVYTLQDLLQQLFLLFEIDHRTSFRTPGNVQEIDGHFHFQGFDYLIEAKWRSDQPTDGEIGSFKHKVDG